MVIITLDGMSNNKSERLRKSGTLNPHPEAVSDPLFEGSPFFDPRDLLQVRYEMIRSHKKDTTLEEVAARFGMSVPTCVRAKRAFREGGLQALIPGRRGPRGPRKITPEILDFAEDYRATHGAVSVRKLAELIRERFDVTIHFSGLHRALLKKTLESAHDAVLHCQDTHRYGRWRQRWLSGLHSQAISMVCHHGLARALVLSARVPGICAPSVPAPIAPSAPLLRQAASMSCHLIHSLRVAYAQTLIP